MKKIYVGNLAFSTTEDQIRGLFAQYGNVSSVHVVMDRETGQPRGFGFVEMETGADEAVRALNSHELDGRSLKVNEARPREPHGGNGQLRR
jgi:cold-inducible RNA-binding protein